MDHVRMVVFSMALLLIGFAIGHEPYINAPYIIRGAGVSNTIIKGGSIYLPPGTFNVYSAQKCIDMLKEVKE